MSRRLIFRGVFNVFAEGSGRVPRSSFPLLLIAIATCLGISRINLLDTAEFCAALFLCAAEVNANYVLIRHCDV